MNVTLQAPPTSPVSWQPAPPTSQISWQPAPPTSPARGQPPRPTSPPRGRAQCGLCTGTCVPDAAKMAFLLGVVVNAVVIARVARDRKLHKPTFMAIASLAAADMLFLAGSLALSADNMAATLLCMDMRHSKYRQYLSEVVLMVWFSATFHVTLLAVLRFLILTRPLLTRRLLTNRRVLLASAALWTLAAVCIGAANISINLPDDNNETLFIVHIAGWFLNYLLPIVITTILHLAKIIFLRRFFAGTSKQNENRRKSLVRMARTIAMVIIAGAVLPLPKFVTKLILDDLLGVQFPKPYRPYVETLVESIFLLKFCINPFIYAFHSPEFMKSIKAMLGLRRVIQSSSQRTPQTTLSLTHTATLPETSPQSALDVTPSNCEHI